MGRQWLDDAKTFANHHLLAVGVPKTSAIRRIAKFAATDARLVAEKFCSHGYPRQQVKVVPPAETSHARLDAHLDRFAQAIGRPGQHGVLFWAGHGTPYPPGSQPEMGVLFASDSHPVVRTDDTFNVPDLLMRLGIMVRPASLTLIFQSCYAGVNGRALTTHAKAVRGSVPLSAFAFPAASFDDERLGSGEVAFFLQAALDTGACSPGKDRIYPNELVEYLAHRIDAYRYETTGEHPPLWVSPGPAARTPIAFNLQTISEELVDELAADYRPVVRSLLRRTRPDFWVA